MIFRHWYMKLARLGKCVTVGKFSDKSLKYSACWEDFKSGHHFPTHALLGSQIAKWSQKAGDENFHIWFFNTTRCRILMGSQWWLPFFNICSSSCTICILLHSYLRFEVFHYWSLGSVLTMYYLLWPAYTLYTVVAWAMHNWNNLIHNV